MGTVLDRLIEERDFLEYRIAQFDPPDVEDYRHSPKCQCCICLTDKHPRDCICTLCKECRRSRLRRPGTYCMALALHRQAGGIRQARLEILNRVIARLTPPRSRARLVQAAA